MDKDLIYNTLNADPLYGHAIRGINVREKPGMLKCDVVADLSEQEDRRGCASLKGLKIEFHQYRPEQYSDGRHH